MSDQPKFITLICWLNIIVGIVIFLELPTFTMYPINTFSNTFSFTIARQFAFTPPNLLVFRFYVTVLICMVSSIFMLRGANWARLLYAILGGAHFIFSIPNQLILGYVIVIYLLFRPKCDSFFSR